VAFLVPPSLSLCSCCPLMITPPPSLSLRTLMIIQEIPDCASDDHHGQPSCLAQLLRLAQRLPETPFRTRRKEGKRNDHRVAKRDTGNNNNR